MSETKTFGTSVEKSSPELTEHQKELLKELEHVSGLTSQDILQIALVYLGLKPAAEVALNFEEGLEDYTPQDYEHNIDEVRQLLKKMELWYEQRKKFPDKDDEDQTIWTSFYLSRSPQTAAQLHEAFTRQNEEKVAKILGYPDSAIKAFPQNSLRVEESSELRKNELAPFLYFRPSQENWREELKTLEPKIKVIQQVMPDLYQKIINIFQRQAEDNKSHD